MIDTKKLALAHQTAIVEYDAPCAFDMDEVFYRIELAKTEYLRDRCVVCEDKKSLTVNGVTFKCPCCESASVNTQIHAYAVRRYRVCGIFEEKQSQDWKPETRSRVKVKLYRKVGRGHITWYNDSQGGTWEIYPVDARLNVPYYDDMPTANHALINFVYSDYALACRVADALTEREIAYLAKINAERGTNYTVEFKQYHDQKSN